MTANTGTGHARRCGPPKLPGEGLGGRGRQGEADEGHTRALAVAERRHDGNEDRWLLELGASAEESERELGNEGKRCGVVWGWSSPFIGVRERWVGGCWEIMASAKALTPLMARGGLRRGFKGGNQGGGVNALMGHLEARSWTVDVVRSNGHLWRCNRAWWHGWGEEGADTWGPHVSDRGEKRRRGWNSQSKGENTLSRGRQWHAGLVGRLGEAAACREGWASSG
jgi:hypothetical protein